MGISVGSKSDRGRRRRRNEDRILVAVAGPRCSRSLFAVADGMGGAPAGHLASAAAIAALKRAVQPGAYGPPGGHLAAAFGLANNAVRTLSASRSGYGGAGTTLVAALVEGPRAWIGNVGDSRAYLVRGASCTRITRDHSWVEEEVRAGLITPEQRASSAYGHVLTRSLGADDTVAPDIFGPIPLARSDRIVLCSDGLHRNVSDAELAEMASAREPHEAAERLVDLANARGGADNISVVVIRLDSSDAAPQPRRHLASGTGLPSLSGAGRQDVGPATGPSSSSAASRMGGRSGAAHHRR